MPIPLSRAGVVALSITALTLLFASVAEAESRTVAGDLRVVSPQGRTLAEHTQYTGTTKIKTDRKASCFGRGTGGSGRSVKVAGPTALGIIDDGTKVERGLRPLSVSDHFPFGLALCGIGRAVAPRSGYWSLRVNHEFAQEGGDKTRVRRNDEVLWYLIEDFNDPIPDELELSAPARVGAGQRFTVRVVRYDDRGVKSPAEGATVTGASEPTNPQGRVTLRGQGLLRLRAKLAGTIPSNREVVCARRRGCPPGYERTIAGTSGRDRIVGGRQAETVVAFGGDDSIDVRRGAAADKVKCGAGRDTLVIERGDHVRSSACERIRRR